MSELRDTIFKVLIKKQTRDSDTAGGATALNAIKTEEEEATAAAAGEKLMHAGI